MSSSSATEEGAKTIVVTGSQSDATRVLSGGGEMGALMRAFDWSKNPLGPVSQWPQSLRTTVRIILTSRYAMFVWWGQELINLYNDPYRAFLGIKHPDALGKSACEVWEEIWDQIGPRADAVLLRGESTFDAALLLLMERHGYLEETYFTFSYSPLPDDEGNVGGLFCAVTEETEQVIGERRLALLRDIAAATAGGGTPAQVCQSAARPLSLAQRDLPFSMIYLLEADGKTLTRAAESGVPANHPAAPSSVSIADESVWPFLRVIETGEPVLVENLSGLISDIPKGEWHHPPATAVLLPIAHQGQARPAGVFVAGVNPYRKFDDEFRGFLTLLVNQIAGALANAIAYETERRRAEALAELDRAKTLFFSNVSHEFRTPLTLMLGPLEELLVNTRQRLSQQEQQQAEVARRNALRLLKLVNTLLDFSRIEAGRMEPVYEPADLAGLTAEVASVFRSAMEKAGLRFSVTCEPISEPIYVDREMWEKIVLNLLSNAFKFTFEGEVRVSLKDHEGSVELAVSDTGVGIPAHELARVFERFHRVENTRARTHEGTGIGLAFVQELVKLHQGTVRVESTAGEGTRFTISIPKGKAHLPPDRIQAKRSVVAGAMPGEGYLEEIQGWLPQLSVSESSPAKDVSQHRELIVLADDNADMREYVRRLLSEQYEVHAVRNGVEAMDAIRRLQPSVVIADIMMPQLDGFGVLHAIRGNPSLSTTPVILLSARAGEEARVEGFQAGADDYLVKPFTARELLVRVGTHVKMAILRREVAEREGRLRKTIEISEERLLLAQSAAQIGTWEWNPLENSRTLSADLHRLFGTDAADPDYVQTWASRVHPDDREKIAKLRQQGDRLGYLEMEYRYRHPELGLRWFYSKGRRLHGGSSMFGVVLDITARKQAELRTSVQQRINRVLAEISDLSEAVREILQAVCEVLDWSVGGLWIVNQQDGQLRGLEVWCDPNEKGRNFVLAGQRQSFAKGIGLPGRVWLERRPLWIPDVTCDTNFPRSALAAADGLHTGFGFPVVANGEVLGVLEFLSHEVRQPDDDLLQMLASIGAQVGQYIQRIQAEQVRYKLAAIVESSDDAIISKDLNGIVTSWNAGAERMFGFKQEEMVGESIIRIIPEELHQDEQRILETLRRGDRIDHFETVRVTRTGERIHVSLTISPIRDQSGKVIGVAKIARDITQQKKAEQALRTTERLASVGRLAATVAHEINNPLEAVTNLVYLAQNAPDKKTAERFLSQAQEELGRVSHLTKQTLGFYREAKGAAPTRIGSLLPPLLAIFSPRMRNKGIQIHTEIRQDPQVMAVSGEIRQLLANFLSNSIDAVEPGGQIKVRLSSAGELNHGCQTGVRLTIADSGCGIPALVRRKLFEPFFTTKKDVGTGLGLWICKSIVEKHGGKIQVKSSAKSGRSWTVFSVLLPLNRESSLSEHVTRQAV